MLFSCLGRGHRLYGEPNHDSNLVSAICGKIPVGGFFCNGEIGPVGGKTFLHGYTSSIAVFRPLKQNKTEKPA
jgi:small ligand-binding sensory domain FIST